MKEVVRVSIAGISFIFDDDAYEVLDRYLKCLELWYDSKPDGRETVADIEARIVEIILGVQTTDNVVAVKLVDSIIDQLGFPDGFDQQEVGQTPPPIFEQFPRRLYRNSDGAKLGGVCNGIATFAKIDTVWVRLALFAPLFFLIITAPFGVDWLSSFFGAVLGSVVLLYFVLWIIIPVARTPRQRLEMRGEKITASSIYNNFQSYDVTNNVRAERAVSVLSEVIYAVGRTTLFVIKLIALIVGFALALACVSLIVCYFAVLFGSDAMVLTTLNYFSGMQGITPEIFLLLLTLIVLVPIMLIVWLIMCLVFNFKNNKLIVSLVVLLWFIIAICTSVFSVKNASYIRSAVDKIIHTEMIDRDFDLHYDAKSDDDSETRGNSQVIHNELQITSSGDSVSIKTTTNSVTTQGDTVSKIIKMEKTVGN